jgi:hypothetical protein
MTIFKVRNNKSWQGCGKIVNLYIVGGNANEYNQYRKQCGDSSRDKGRTAI